VRRASHDAAWPRSPPCQQRSRFERIPAPKDFGETQKAKNNTRLIIIIIIIAPTPRPRTGPPQLQAK
jgi:hypothetical protein